MGSIIELNDTLQITREQGFPAELDLEKHRVSPLRVEDFENRIFEFKDKSKIRIYPQAPVRNFLVENRNGKWIYWGLVHVLSLQHDHVNQTTSGTYKIVRIYTPEQMEQIYDLVEMRPEKKFNILNS